MAQKPFTVCVDMDDTIERLVPAWLCWLNAEYGTSVTNEKVTDWDICQFFPQLTREQVFAPLDDPEFWETVYPVPKAAFYIYKLITEGVEVYVCTSSHYSSVTYKMQAIIEAYFPFIDWKHIIVCHDKKMIRCDVLVDDGVHNLEDNPAEKILFTTPVNALYRAEENGMYRAYCWKEVYDIIQDIRKKFS